MACDHYSYTMLLERQLSLHYCTPPRLASVEDRSCLERLLGRLRHGGYLLDDFPTVESLAGAADHKSFVSIAGNPHHVLRHYFHEKESSGYNLCAWARNFLPPAEDDRNFVSCSIYAELNT